MAFDGLAVSCMVHELNDILTNGRVDKVLQPEYDEIILGVRAGGKNRRLVLSASSSNPRVHLTSVQKENPEKAPMFCMLLRKHLMGGKVVGVTYRAAGGLIGRAADYIQIINCENTGDVYVAAVESNRKHAYSPVVGGICGVQGNGSENTIVNSKNTGKVTAMVPFAECVSSTYACEAVANKLFDPESTAVDKNKCDEATITASAGAVVTAILPAQWTTTLPEGWL